MFIGGCFFVKANQAKEFEKKDYGVFLNADASSLERFKMYETIVIDAQYFTKRDIELLHQNGTVVYTYLNIGSIENFREYYTTYAELAIGEYEHWEEEEWVDVANPDWQKFIGQLSQELYEKGVDGFFIDNCDVYYYDPHESIFEGITAILQNMMTFGKAVIINGGDTYVTEYRERYGAIDQIMTGVNQESVWSSIDFDSGTFREQTSETRDYFCKYQMHIYESSRRNRPKDLTLLGKCDGIHYPLNNSSKGGHFCWSRVDIREILYGYENQLKLDNED